MSRRISVSASVVAAQRAAADPRASVWVGANAGSGKTHVLTQRVLRLLLSGVDPGEILCLTYTKAAAAEMRTRVGEKLGQWALLPPAALRASLTDITGNIASEAEQIRARTLFAHALDTPGGLKIQTIHAFCESILHRFPVEAGVPFDFTVLEDHQRAAMILRAREAVLAGGLAGSSEAKAVETLLGAMTDFAITEAIDEAFARGRPLRHVLADAAGAKARLRALVDDTGESVAALRAMIETETLLLPGDCRELVARLGGDARKGGNRFANKVAAINLDRQSSGDLLNAFLTNEGRGDPVKSLMNKEERLRHPELYERFELERQRLGGLGVKLRRAQLIERSEALLDILGAIIARYEAEKRARSLLDFDDLIEHAAALLANQNQGLWVRFKLDAAISHILVDESQDTNKEQWQVVKLLADEFFVGDSAVQRPRTVFAVGDGKQSIYSFQGANPALFGRTGVEFEERAIEARLAFARLPLTTSFRTLPNVLAAVDNVFSDENRHRAMLQDDSVRHHTARAEPGGLVTLWTPVQATPIAEAAAGEEAGWPLLPPDAMQSAPRQVATRIAREIRGWIDSGRPLGPRGRPVRPEDVLILVQTRAALFHEIIRALLGAGLPTPGADRLYVTTHVAVLDLMALGDVLLNTADDLQLAALLRSPLFDLDEDDLYAIAQGRDGSLWSALKASTNRHAMAAYNQLKVWRSRLDFDRPYEFYAQVLYAEGGLRRFHTRFGPEVDDLFGEFLDLALEHESASNPSLQGFLAEMRSREVTITRELGTSKQGVRVMTVHGAKGLEAPIVILADAASKPQGRQLVKPVLIDDDRGLLIHASASGDHVPGTSELRAEAEAAAWAEYWRKLYVAMTRAEDELYVTGALTPGKSRESQLKGTWYEAIESSLAAESEPIPSEGEAEPIGYIYPRERPAPEPVAAAAVPPIAPTQALVLAKLPERTAIPMVRPSTAFEPSEQTRALATAAESVVDAEAARREGIALHALLQHLPGVERGLWPAVGLKAVAVLLPETPARHAALVEKATSILTRPGLAALFSAQSRAEVPFLFDAWRDDKPVTLAGRIDRLVVTPESVLVVDFKSDAGASPDPESVPPAYATQLGLYALVASQLFPGRKVEAAILWTALELLVNLPDDRLAAAASAFTAR